MHRYRDLPLVPPSCSCACALTKNAGMSMYDMRGCSCWLGALCKKTGCVTVSMCLYVWTFAFSHFLSTWGRGSIGQWSFVCTELSLEQHGLHIFPLTVCTRVGLSYLRRLLSAPCACTVRQEELCSLAAFQNMRPRESGAPIIMTWQERDRELEKTPQRLPLAGRR